MGLIFQFMGNFCWESAYGVQWEWWVGIEVGMGGNGKRCMSVRMRDMGLKCLE